MKNSNISLPNSILELFAACSVAKWRAMEYDYKVLVYTDLTNELRGTNIYLENVTGATAKSLQK